MIDSKIQKKKTAQITKNSMERTSRNLKDGVASKQTTMSPNAALGYQRAPSINITNTQIMEEDLDFYTNRSGAR